MEVIKDLNKIKIVPDTSITVGSFDGLHLGHQRIIQQMRKLEGMVTLLTFDPHPQSVVKPNQSPPPLLTSFDERLSLFEKIGVDRLIVTPFDKEFSVMSPKDFIENVLVNILGMKYIFVGPRHRFGQDRSGDVNLLKRLSKKFDFEVSEVEPVNRFGEVISSSRIRKLLSDGDALTAWRCLGRPYYIEGTVVKGDDRGKRIGFPTANIEPIDDTKLIPPSGVYATVTEVDGVRWPSVSHFGPRPTFRGATPALETFLIGFREEIYGKVIRVGLIDKLRDIRTFKSVTELVGQLGTDVRGSAQRLAELGFGPTARLRIQRYGKILQ